jgi:hypothetical protein
MKQHTHSISRKPQIVLLLFMLCQYCAQAQHWQKLLDGPNNYPLSIYSDTSFDELYIGGHFTEVDSIRMWGIASWDGSRWDSLGCGIDDSSYTNAPFTVSTMAHYGGYMYVGGNFLRAGNLSNTFAIARWDGLQWSSVPQGRPNNAVDQLYVHNNDLYACGYFDSIGSVAANGIAKWDGVAWQSIGTNYAFADNSGYGISSCIFYNGSLYVAGMFTDPLGNTCRIAKWNGSNWQFMANAVQGTIAVVSDLEVYNNKLYVSGLFYASDGNAGNSIISWNDTAWCAVGGSVQIGVNAFPKVKDLCIHNGQLYCVGNFQKIGGVPALGLARWDGSQWCSFGAVFNSPFQQYLGADLIAFYDDTMYVGGGFQYADTTATNFIVKWLGGNFIDSCGSITTGVEQYHERFKYSIFPNPASDRISLQIDRAEESECIIINTVGQEVMRVKSGESNHFDFSVASLECGVYFFQYQENNGRKGRGKFVVQH